MENQQDPLDDSPAPAPQHKNKARSYVDAVGTLYETLPSGWAPVLTAPGWTNIYTEFGTVHTAIRNQLTIIEEIPVTTPSQEEFPSGSSVPGWGWVTESSTYTIDIETESSLSSEPVTTSESTRSGSVTIPYTISTLPQIPWLSKISDIVASDSVPSTTITETIQITESSQTTATPEATTMSTTTTLPTLDTTTSTSVTWPSSTAYGTPEPSSTSTAQWVGVIVGSVCGFILVMMFILSIIFRDKPKTPPRENQNNINIRLDNRPFNRPLAETNPGCVPEGWDDIRG